MCPRCQSLVDSGKVDKQEIGVMKTLIELEESGSFRSLKDIKYVKTIWLDNLAIIMIRGSSLSPSEMKKLAKNLSEIMGIRVQVVEYTKDIRKMAAELVSPARVSGVNMVWLPDGSTQYVIRISRSDQRFLPARKEVIEEALNRILGSQTRLRIE